MTKINRLNKRKQKKGCGCKLCKPHKGKYAHQFKNKVRAKIKSMIQEVKDL